MPKSPDPAAFEGFAPDALGFFDELDGQQTREWFLAHKDRYERTIRDPLGGHAAAALRVVGAGRTSTQPLTSCRRTAAAVASPGGRFPAPAPFGPHG